MMEKYNYGKVIYENNICSLENIDEFKKIVKDFKYVEEKLKDFTPCLDEIRELIILSFKFDKDLKADDRVNFIRGIVFSKHYFDEDDIQNFIEEVDSYNLFFKNTNISIYKSVEYKEEALYPLDKILEYQKRIPSIKEIDELKKDIVDNISNDSKDSNKNNSNIAFMDDDLNELKKELETLSNGNFDIELISMEEENDDEYLDLSIKLTPEEKLEYLKVNFIKYIDAILDQKNITDKRETEFVKKGMVVWFNQVYQELESIYKLSLLEREKNDKTLFNAL